MHAEERHKLAYFVVEHWEEGGQTSHHSDSGVGGRGREIDTLKNTCHSSGTTSTVQLKFEIRDTDRELPSIIKFLMTWIINILHRAVVQQAGPTHLIV
jgi:hypothetical protein